MAKRGGLSWTFWLFDRFSAPARRIDASLGKVEKTLDRVNKRTRQHTTEAGRSERATRKLGDAHRHAGRHGSSFFLKLTGWYVSMQAGIMMVRGLARALFGLPTAFAKAGLSAAAFKEQTLLGLGTMLGSQAKGAGLFAEADRMAKATGTPLREMVDRYQQLVAMGFEGDRLRQVLAGVGDLAIVGGQGKAARALLAITQIKAKGRLSAEELMQQLAETGVDIDAVYKILGRRTGLAKPGLLKAMEKGQIGSDLGIEAVLEFIQNRYSGGKLGSMAAKYSKTGPGLWANLTSAPDRFLMDLDKSAGYAKAKKALENLVAVLDPETPQGKRLKAKATEMFDRMFGGLFDRFQKPEEVERWISDLIDGFGRLIPAAESLAKSVGSIAENLSKTVELAHDLFGGGLGDKVFELLNPGQTPAWRTLDLAHGTLAKPGQSWEAAEKAKKVLDSAGVKMTPAENRNYLDAYKKRNGPPTSMHLAPGAIQIQVHGAQDPRAVGDEVEERLSAVFERLGIAQGVA
jgi:tape measure domain-containing protein